MPVHDVFHGGVVVGQKQFPERYCAEQMFLPVEHIDDVDGLAGTCSGSDGSECRRDARFRQNGNIFGSRDRAGAFSGEGGQFENVVPGMFSEDGKNLLLQMRVQKRIKIRSFVGGQMFEQLRCLFNGHGMEEDGLERLGKIAEQGGLLFRSKPAGQRKNRGGRKRAERFRKVGGMNAFRHVHEGTGMAGRGQFTDGEKNILTDHGMFPPEELSVRKSRKRTGASGSDNCGMSWKTPFGLRDQ